ncbi:MAG: site-specific integrase [Clostridia bacterium]
MAVNLRGTLQERRGVYHMVIEYYINGKRKQKSITTKLPVKNNKRNAELMLKKALNEFKIKEENPSGEMLFCDYLVEWLELNRLSWKDRTYIGYFYIVKNQMYPFFKEKNIKMEDLKAYHLQEYYDMKLKKDKVKGKTLMRHHAIIHKCLKYATRLEVISRNPAENVVLPKVEKYHGDYYNADEIRMLLEVCKDTELETVVFLTQYYGLRRSEVLGLRWSSINFEEKTLKVENALVQVPTGNGKTELISSSSLKTDSSYRTLPLLDIVEKHLKALLVKREGNINFYGNTYDRQYEDYICLFDDGRIISPNFITSKFPRILKTNNLRKIRFHDLRHSCASLLVSQGVQMKDIQVWLGHNNLATTADIYSHIDFKSKVAVGERIANSIAL